MGVVAAPNEAAGVVRATPRKKVFAEKAVG